MKKIIPLDITHSIEYDNSCVLSRGNYADVYYAHVVRHEKKKRNFFICGSSDFSILEDEVIIKILNIKSCKGRTKAAEIENEIQILLELENEPNIIHIKKYVAHVIYKNWAFIGLECCRGGDLFEHFRKRNKVFNENDVKIISAQIINAVNACHKHGIVHGDIKLENIGLVRCDDISELKLLDFGGSYKMGHLDDDKTHAASEFGITASPHYISPELASSTILIKECELIYTDFWELGIICYVLLTGSFPFGNMKSNLDYIKKCVLRDEIKWPKDINISNEMKKFVGDLLKKKPQERCLKCFD